MEGCPNTIAYVIPRKVILLIYNIHYKNIIGRFFMFVSRENGEVTGAM